MGLLLLRVSTVMLTCLLGGVTQEFLPDGHVAVTLGDAQNTHGQGLQLAASRFASKSQIPYDKCVEGRGMGGVLKSMWKVETVFLEPQIHSQPLPHTYARFRAHLTS